MIPASIRGVALTLSEREILDLLMRRQAVFIEGLRMVTNHRPIDTAPDRPDGAFHTIWRRFEAKMVQLGIHVEEYDGIYRIDSINKAKIRAMME